MVSAPGGRFAPTQQCLIDHLAMRQRPNRRDDPLDTNGPTASAKTQISRGPVAFFLPTLTGGGAQRIALNLAQGFVDSGVATDLVAVNGVGELAERVPMGVRMVDLKRSRVILGLPPLVAYLRRERPTTLISFLDHAGVIALWARRLSGTSTRVVCTVHNALTRAAPTSSNLRSRIMPLFLRAFYPSADEVVAVSHGVAQELSKATGFPLARIRVIYNPVITGDLLAARDRAPAHPWLTDSGPPVILGAGRLTRQKDFQGLIRAFALVRQRRPARLLIMGEGPERPALEALVRELGLQAEVSLPGFVVGAHECMAKAAVFVLSSVWEGLPTVLIEALAVGTRVVSTDCPSGPREILRGGQLGRLVPVGDVGALAEGILAALGDAGRYVPLDQLKEFTQEVAVQSYLDLTRNGSG
jgi:glycosyltransferase involved in cell wall biosynthesis